MPRAATTTDVFNAIAEPRRREIIDALRGGRVHAVGELVRKLRIPQPAVSKHLGVLRRGGIFSARRKGRDALYQSNAEGMRSGFVCVIIYEGFCNRNLARIQEAA